MSIEYQPFLISQFKTGMFNYLDPWTRPQDAFDPLVNAYTYRGDIVKRNGYSQLGTQLADELPVMGIMSFVVSTSNLNELIVASEDSLYKFNISTENYDLIGSIADSIFFKGTATGSGVAMNTFWPNLSPNSVSITDGTTTITDDGLGNLSSGGIFAAGGTVNYTAGTLSLNFSGSTANVTLKLTATSTGGYFTGNISNFFNWTNWQPSEGSSNYLIMVNNKDPVTFYDGTHLKRDALYVDSTYATRITTALDAKIFKNRLLLISPTLSSSSTQSFQEIAYSAVQNMTNFIADVAGNGGNYIAGTSDYIVATEFLRDYIVVFFNNSTWVFVYTGNSFDPFAFRKISSAKTNKCPYGTVAYDERVTSLGSNGFIACDGVNVQRFDINIIDFFETQMSSQYFAQTFAQRYDNLNQAWMLYVSNGNEDKIDNIAPASDKILIYNYVEQSWATYTPATPLTCLGTWNRVTGATWADMTMAWSNADAPWNTYSGQALMPILLAGDANGNIYVMDDDFSNSDNGEPIKVDIVSTRWNPFIGVGQKTQMGYLDIYYSVSPKQTELTLYFYTDNNNRLVPALEKPLVLDGPSDSDYAWKRVPVNLTGEFIQLEIDPDSEADFKILGLLLWMRPAGRLTGP